MHFEPYDYARVATSNDLGVRYIADFPRVESFYASDYASPQALSTHALKLLNRTWRSRYDRNATADLLDAYARGHGAPAPVLENIARLRDKTTVCVMTGQQAGLGGGPLFFLYKAVTAIRLADELERVGGVPVVPVFWNASDDSDIEEVNRFRSIADGKLQRFRFNLESGRRPVRDVRLPERKDPQWEKLFALLPEGPGKSRARLWLEHAAGQDFGSAFTELVLDLLSARGLVVVEPKALTSHPDWKRILALEIDQRDVHRLAMRRVSDRLESMGFSAGVPVTNQVNLFQVVDGERRRIVSEGTKLVVDGVHGTTTKSALIAALRKDPAAFTPNVLLRPVVQNAIFPTVAYVGGPAEIAYHAVLKPLHRSAEVFMPALFPRMSITLLEKGDPFSEVLAFRSKLKWRQTEADILFASAENHLHADFAQLRADLQGLARPMEAELAKFEKRSSRSVASVRHKVQHEPLDISKGGREMQALLARYFPDGNAQERELTFAGEYARRGDSLIEVPFQHPNIFDFRHFAVKPT
ncbi:MAG: bacillithiol biosynthesis cysteine-adding enzyme BshC [Planctomycetes bacterium]|nr:bacillithiol biosynthesis cysteine-adding enzyme BshC [Planctomycetota bacterium]